MGQVWVNRNCNSRNSNNSKMSEFTRFFTWTIPEGWLMYWTFSGQNSDPEFFKIRLGTFDPTPNDSHWKCYGTAKLRHAECCGKYSLLPRERCCNSCVHILTWFWGGMHDLGHFCKVKKFELFERWVDDLTWLVGGGWSLSQNFLKK